jgi:hypothetical protein
MNLPPSVKSLFPSLKIGETGDTATLALADLRRQFPSLTFRNEGRDVTNGLMVTMSMVDLRRFLRIVLSDIEVDEKWYLSQVPRLLDSIKKGNFSSAADHYRLHGFLESRLPTKPTVDETYYLKTYPDIAHAVRTGKLRNAFEHFVATGYAEGRRPVPAPQQARQ